MSGNMYDDQFADRIQGIRKGGAAPPTGSKGKGGWAVTLVVIVVAAALRSLSRPSYTPPAYTPPPQFVVPPAPQFRPDPAFGRPNAPLVLPERDPRFGPPDGGPIFPPPDGPPKVDRPPPADDR